MFQYSGKSFFSSIREEAKIFFFLASILSAFLFNSIDLQLMLSFLTLSFLLGSGFRNFKQFLYLLPFLAIADLSFWFFLQNTGLDLVQIIVVSNIRIFNLLMASSFFSFSTDIFALLKLMKRVKLPEFIYLPVYVLFRFLPEIERDLLEIKSIQKLRGISPKKPLLYFKSILLPLLYTLFQKSDELAVAYYLRKKCGRA